MKERAILAFHVGEFGWEILRFAPHVLWTKREKYENKVKLIVCSRWDREDLYGDDADIFVPFSIDESGLKQDCFKLTGFEKEYKEWMMKLSEKYCQEYDIIEEIYPRIDKRAYTQRNQYPQNEMDYDFQPREGNEFWFKYLAFGNDDERLRPLIALAPRFRKDTPRNWPYWQEFYDLLKPLEDKFEFVICGKEPDVIPDRKDRFSRLYHIEFSDPDDMDLEASLVGITIITLEHCILTVGSQSGIPNLSNILGTPTLQWGNEKHEHTKTYNVKNTETIYLDDPKFNIAPDKVYQEMINFLNKKGYL